VARRRRQRQRRLGDSGRKKVAGVVTCEGDDWSVWLSATISSGFGVVFAKKKKTQKGKVLYLLKFYLTELLLTLNISCYEYI
jgi:hypothetical protein